MTNLEDISLAGLLSGVLDLAAREFSAKGFLIQLIIHIFCVGLTIALIVSHLSR
jgi:hypothetical protein